MIPIFVLSGRRSPCPDSAGRGRRKTLATTPNRAVRRPPVGTANPPDCGDDRASAPSRNAITSLTLPAEQARLAFEHYPDEIAFAPYQSTFAVRSEIVERQIEVDWHHLALMQTNAGA
jgi:hypothetical protein